jgi:predicted metalloprotease
MEWTPDNSNQDIEDRRGESGGSGGFGGSGFGLPHLGIGGLLIVGVLSLVFHQNFFALFSGGSQATYQTRPAHPQATPGKPDREMQFIAFVLHDVQNFWDKALPAQAHVVYRHAILVPFRDSTPSPCGTAGEATGPFYCPADEKVYLDFGFFDELKNRFKGSNAEFAQAYVVAHELGHHVQKILGIESKVSRLEHQHPARANALSVDTELQADCLAGVWGHSAQERHIIDITDIQAAMSAAAAVGDDRLQKMATGHVSPERFTHGSAAQRTAWLKKGLDSGNISSCNTFSASR